MQGVATAARRARGRFIVLDGVDGCGKSTQASRLVRSLETERGRAPVHLREPGSTALGEKIRALVLGRGGDLEAGVETLLFLAARRSMLAERVGPALRDGVDVVCERFHPSTFAYQAVAGGLDEERVLALLATWAGEPAPDLVIVLDTAPEVALLRRGAPTDRIEDKGLEFQKRVADGFRRYVARVPGTVLVDGGRSAEEVEREVLEKVRSAI